MKCAIIGASGYTGAELMRILAFHPQLDLVAVGAASQAGVQISQVFPSLYSFYGDKTFGDFETLVAEVESGSMSVDVLFLALPHGVSQRIIPRLYDKVRLIVDLSADFRLRDASQYPRWYGSEHPSPAYLEMAVYGLPELTRSELRDARLIASAGCYVTASTLPLLPLVCEGLIERSGIIIDAASGVSGAGRSLKSDLLFGEVDENFSVYGLKNHRHTPEIEQNLGAEVLFTPHLLPTNRGILATTYSKPSSKFIQLLSDVDDPEKSGTLQLTNALKEAYDSEPFVFVVDDPPSIKSTLGSNNAFVFATYDKRTGTVITISVLDNLVKGASGQAVQCANIALGLPEDSGLQSMGLYP